MEIERDPIKMQYVVKIEREKLERAFTSQNEYNAFIMELSKQIYEYARKRDLI